MLVGAATPPTYDGLVALGIAQGREGRTDAAGETLGRAIALDPGRPEALVERGGLRFLQRRYDDAIDDLQAALRIRDDAYARDLLASTLLLTGRNDPAIEEWNRLGKPALGKVRIAGLRHAREPAVRRELTVDEGRRLDVDDYRRTRLRLDETGFFDALEMRPVVTAPGAVDLEIDVLERHGFGGLPELVGRGVADLTREKVRLRYANLGPRDHRRRRVQVGGDPALPRIHAGRVPSARLPGHALDRRPGGRVRPTTSRTAAGRSGCGPAAGECAGAWSSPAARWPRPACASATAPGTPRGRTRRTGTMRRPAARRRPHLLVRAGATTSWDRSGP